MNVTRFRKLDQKNRLHIPYELMQLLGIEAGSDVCVSYEPGDDYLRIYPKSFVNEEIRKARIAKNL